ncbi:MAG: hypothetical protein H6730_17355 [Deltaproteobacteria bacterium]|nr:hypothetical protein [Deltaproteobacteria bacterium]
MAAHSRLACIVALGLTVAPSVGRADPTLRDVNLEAEVGVGGGYPLSSSRFALGADHPDEVGPAPTLELGLKLHFPNAWLMVGGTLAVGGVALRSDLFESTDPYVEPGGGGLSAAADVEVRPPWLGWTPFARVRAGVATMGTKDKIEECDRTSTRRSNLESRCKTVAFLDHLNFHGFTAGLGVGVMYSSLPIQRVQAGVTLEARYTLTRWSSVKFVRANGDVQDFVVEENDRIDLGEGPRMLHQVIFMVGAASASSPGTGADPPLPFSAAALSIQVRCTDPTPSCSPP